jgi:hypothetical protein
MMRSVKNNIVSLLFVLVFCTVATVTAYAQSPTILQASVGGPKGQQTISVAFSTSFAEVDLAAATNAANYFVLEMSRRRAISVTNPRFLKVPGFADTLLALDVDPNEFIDLKATGARYYLFAENLTFGNKPIKNPLQVKIGALPTSDVSPPFIIKESKTRQDSNVYVAGEINGARNSDIFASVDIKVDVPLNIQKFWNKTHVFSPFFDLRASTDPQADPDTMNLGFRWSFPLLSRSVETPAPGEAASGKFYSDLHWDNSGKIEGNRNFDNVNAIWESRFVAPLNFLNTRTTKFFLDPFFGSEVGGNLESPVLPAKGKAISRLLAGSTMSFVLPFQKEDMNLFVLEAAYIRRWLLKEEVTFRKNEDGKLVPLFIGTSPRDFVEAKFNFKFNKFFGGYAGYEYGELPPVFNKVDHRFRIGLVYKMRIDRDARGK